MVRTALRLLLAAWALTCSGPLVLHAQDAPYRTQLKDLCEALDSAASVARVELIKARWDAPTGNPVERLGDAYAELRLGALTNDRDDLTTAWEHFDQVVRVHPDWPYARLGLAKAALEIYSRRYPLPAMYDDVPGGTHYDGYVIEMKRLLKEEPTFEPATAWLAEMLSAEGDREQPKAVLELLQYAADSTGNKDPQVQLILARTDRLKGKTAQSVRRIDAFLREGGDSGVGDLEMAHSLAWMGELENAAIEYVAGAHVQTIEARANYRRDLSWVAKPRELAQYDSLPADSVGAWIGHFWRKRDVQELRPDGSRLEEHLRRWVYVSQNFRVPDPGRRTAYRKVYIPYDASPCSERGANSLDDYDYSEPAREGGFRTWERVFNHRAIVYMRHGEPAYHLGGDYATLSYGSNDRTNPALENSPLLITGPRGPVKAHVPAQVGFEHHLTWVYFIGGELSVFNFSGNEALGSNTASTLLVGSRPNLGVLQQLAPLSPMYARLADETEFATFSSPIIRPTCQRGYLAAVKHQREDAAVAVKTDSYLRQFKYPLQAAIQLAAMGQPAHGTGELLAVLAVRTGELTGEMRPGDTNTVHLSLRLQVAAIDSLTGESVRIDTVRQFVTRKEMVQRNAWISFITRMPLQPGLREVRLSVEQDDRGSVFGAAIDPAGANFSASDLVLGNERGSVAWRRNDATVEVSPFMAYIVGESVPIYYELYGLQGGGTYRTNLALRRSGDTKLTSSLSFTDKASAPTMTSNRALTLNNVKPGPYELIVTVDEMDTGRRVVRQRAISVEARPRP